MLTSARRAAAIIAAAAALPASLLMAAPRRRARRRSRTAHAPQYQVRVILNGADLRHTFIPAGKKKARTEALSSPDDIAVLGHDIYTTFQNGVGPQGQPSPDGNTDSTIVEFTASGHVVRQWDLHGKCDGITADTGKHLLIATVNEDAHSSVYTITPGAAPGAPGPALPLQHPAAAQRRHRRHLDLGRPDPDQRVGARHDRQARPAADLPGRVLGDVRPRHPGRHRQAAVL